MNADRKLAKRLLRGDERSFRSFFEAYYPRLFRFALVRLDHDSDLADEAAQEALCRAIDHLSSYRGEAPLFTWLCTFCRHEVGALRRDRLRAAAETGLVEDNPAVRQALESLHKLLPPDAELSRQQLAGLVQTTLDHLPALYADVLEAKYVAGCSVNEISARIDRSPKAAESLLTRAREAFRTAFVAVVKGGVSLSPDHRWKSQ